MWRLLLWGWKVLNRCPLQAEILETHLFLLQICDSNEFLTQHVTLCDGRWQRPEITDSWKSETLHSSAVAICVAPCSLDLFPGERKYSSCRRVKKYV